MTFNDNIIDFYKKNITQEPISFYFSAKNYYFCSYKTWDEPKTLRYIIKDYEKFYNKTFSKNCLYPLYNSYIIPIEMYEKIMPWVIQLYDKLYPWCIQSPNASHFAHIGGIYERIMAYAIGEESLQYINVNVSHINEYKQLSY
jgi:hypothetical protein